MDLTSFGYAIGFQKGFFENKDLSVAGPSIRSTITAAIFISHSYNKNLSKEEIIKEALNILKDKNLREQISKTMSLDDYLSKKHYFESLFLDHDLKLEDSDAEKYNNANHKKLLKEAFEYLDFVGEDVLKMNSLYFESRLKEK